MGPDDILFGKRILIIGAAGNWGTHMAAGMGLAGRADLVLVDTENHKSQLEKLHNEVGNVVNVTEQYVSEDQLLDRYNLLQKLYNQFGTFDAVMDLTGINKYE